MFSNLKSIIENTGYNGCLKAKSRSHQEISKGKTERVKVQKSKVDAPSPNPNSDENGNEEEPGERSASKRMRSRSHRSSQKSEKIETGKTKGDSNISSTEKRRTRNKVSLTNQNLRSFVESKLSLYRDESDSKYNGLIKILADPGFLQFCYLLIKGKPGNMSKGITNETLDGISYE